MGEKQSWCGVDIGASATKVVVVGSNREIIGHRVKRSGAEGARFAEEGLDAILSDIGLTKDDIASTVATGYARESLPFASFTRTEIACHGKGCLHYFQGPITIVDIGGQDNKIITLDKSGKRLGFKFNRKCAAGTGAFLEEIANLLAMPVEDLNDLAEKAESPVKLGSFCTVFTKTEILTNFKRGDKVADIVAGAFESVVKRIVEMDPLAGDIVLTGGVVEHNPYIVGLFEKTLGKPVKVPPHPQLTGAFGAALLAMEEYGG